MKGKEALNLLFCTSEGLPEDKVYECKKILDKELDELTKYKKAFEVLKNKLKIGVCLQDDYPDGWTLYGGGTKILSQEEYELLEELLKS